MEDLESRVVMSSYTLSGTTGDDVVLIRRDPTNAAAIEVRITQGTTISTDVSLAVVAGDSITVNAGDGNNRFDVENTFSGVALTLNGGTGNDTARFSPTAQFLDNILGDVTFKGGSGGTDVLDAFDQLDTFNDTYTETSSYVQRTFSARLNYSAVDQVYVYSGTANVTHQVQSTAAGVTMTITGSTGNDAVQIAPTARNLGNIAGNLVVNGAGGVNSLTVDDQSNPAASTWTVTGSTVSRTGSATITYSSMSAGVIINGRSGGGGGTETYNIVGTSTNNPVTINAGTGNHAFVVSPAAQNLDAIQGALSLLGTTGANTLVVNDQNNTRADSYTLKDSSVSRTNSALITFGIPSMVRTVHAGSASNTVTVLSTPTTGSLLFDGGGNSDTLVLPDAANTIAIANLNTGNFGLLDFSSMENFKGGSKDDVFQFAGAGSISGTINGQGGTNTLDFSAKTAPVTVNLLTGTSTFTGGVSKIRNVTGGSGNDLLFGDGQDNTLVGNDGADVIVGNDGNDNLNGNRGRDVIIGGNGSDTLGGGDDDDLEIGGRTSYDANTTALQAILAEWTSANSYATRVNDLRTGVGLSAGNYLQATGASRTVFDDGSADTVTGGRGLDWFFQATGDVITDLNNGGTESTN
jgi:hypothetical protein